jgi:hypothetical protein
MFTDKELTNAKASTYKLFTIAILSELIREHLIQEDRDFFTNKWFLTNLAAVIGLVTFNLFTYKVSNKIKEGSLFNSLIGDSKFPDFWKICLTDCVKYTTQNVIKSLLIYLFFKKQPKSILSGIIIGMIGTVGFEILFNSKIAANEKKLIENTEFYKSFLLYSKTIKETIKASISILGADIAHDGDIDTDNLISFLIVTLSLPFFFLVIEPTLINDSA